MRTKEVLCKLYHNCLNAINDAAMYYHNAISYSNRFYNEPLYGFNYFAGAEKFKT